MPFAFLHLRVGTHNGFLPTRRIKMCKDNERSDLEYAAYLIHYKVGRLIGILGYSWDDRDDLEQELMLHFLQRWPTFDPERGTFKTFCDHILNNCICQIIERKKTQKAGFGKWTLSLDERIRTRGKGTIRRIDAISNKAQMLCPDTQSSELQQSELKIDVERVISRLSPELQELCSHLSTKNVTQISQESGVPRHVLYKSIRKLRRIFEEAGLKNYL